MGHGEKKLDFPQFQKNNEPVKKGAFSNGSSEKNKSSDVRLKTKHINPYNFVPFGLECVRSPYQKGDLTGKIHCTLVPKTDFFVPNTSNDSCKVEGKNVEKHKIREFFSYGNLKENHKMTSENAPQDPVVPGSELRGMVRSMYEAVTDSCLSAFDEDKELSSRTAVPNLPGILKHTESGWVLYKAETYKVEYKQSKDVSFTKKNGRLIGSDGKEYTSFSEVRFNFKSVETKNRQKKLIISKRVTEFGNKGSKSGYLLIGDDFPRKHFENIFANTKEIVCSDNDRLEDSVNAYNKILKYYNDSKINKSAKKQTFYADSHIDTNNHDRVYPVWYKKVEENIYLSPACIGRYIYQNKLTDFIRNYKPCTSKDCACEACSMFGFVNDGVLSSSVRFSDAVFTGSKPEYNKITTLKELSGPKITSMDMYTHLVEGESGLFWTYDFFIDGQKYRILDKDALLLNGRKFYYHSKENYEAEQDKNNNVMTERNTTVRPLKGCESNKFEFDVYFEHISEEQLKKLLVVLSLRGNDSEYAYKLGTGKPLGMGSVKIKVDDVFIRQIDKDTFEYDLMSFKDKYEKYFIDDKLLECFNFSSDSEMLKSLEQLTSLNYVKEHGTVSYPAAKDEYGNLCEGYQWFVNNRGGVNRPQFDQFLYTAKDGLFDNKKLNNRRR